MRLLKLKIALVAKALASFSAHILNELTCMPLCFYLLTTTPDDLILNTADFVDKLMDVCEAITLKWSTAELVLCCLEANKQVG